MPKMIVGKGEINTDRSLAIIKAFRLANKRAGEVKHQCEEEGIDPDMQEELIAKFNSFCEQLNSLKQKAEEAGFHIWVGMNGKTGHTYTKDYKPTADADNNWDEYQAQIAAQQASLDSIINGTPSEN